MAQENDNSKCVSLYLTPLLILFFILMDMVLFYQHYGRKLDDSCVLICIADHMSLLWFWGRLRLEVLLCWGGSA